MKHLIALLMLVGSAFGQGGLIGQTAFAKGGIANATVRVCTYSANPATPCAATTNIYSDIALTQQLVNPTIADAQGNVQIFATPGVYTCQFSKAGYTTKTIACMAAAGGSGGISLASNNTWTGIQTFSAIPVFSAGKSDTEIAAPAGVSGKSITWADSTAHRLQMNNNNGGAQGVVGAITTDTFNNKTFDTAGTGNVFKINGTTISAITGTGSAVLGTGPSVASPTISGAITLLGGTSGNTVLQPNATASGTLTLPAATDTLVGQATSDTLTSKTIDSATNTLKLNGQAVVNAPGILVGYCSGTATSSQSTLGLFGLGQTSAVTCDTVASDTTGSIPSPSVGNIKNLRVKCGTAGRLGSSGVFTVYKNGGASTLTCTVGAGTTCSDTSHTVSVAAADTLAIAFSTQSAETLANCRASFEKY